MLKSKRPSRATCSSSDIRPTPRLFRFVGFKRNRIAADRKFPAGARQAAEQLRVRLPQRLSLQREIGAHETRPQHFVELPEDERRAFGQMIENDFAVAPQPSRLVLIGQDPQSIPRQGDLLNVGVLHFKGVLPLGFFEMDPLRAGDELTGGATAHVEMAHLDGHGLRVQRRD